MKVKKEIAGNHRKLESDIKELIKNGLEVVLDNYHINNQKYRGLKLLLLESFLLRSCAYWENFLEKEIILLIKLNPETFRHYFDLPPTTSLNHNLIRAVLIGDKYRDWHDIQALRSYFNKIIDSTVNPFKELSKEQLDSLNFTYILRNYLSHYSEYSKQKLFLMYKEYYYYKKFIEPGSFLIKEKGKHFESLLHNLILISFTIRKKIGV